MSSQLTEHLLKGLRRRWQRRRRRRVVGRSYDMALEVARVIPRYTDVLDVGCGDGFISHHLSAILRSRVVGIDLTPATEAPIEYLRFDGKRFPVENQSFDGVLLCYVLHHAQNSYQIMSEVRRVLRDGGLVVVYEDIPKCWWDRTVCWIHNLKWRSRTGPCTFHGEDRWSALFSSAGFEILSDRPLSRWRNFAHPVSRRFYLLKAHPVREGEDASVFVPNQESHCQLPIADCRL
jgi:SAM-dependent methyltransferase